MRSVQLRRAAALAFMAAVFAEPVFAQQKISITVAAGQPPRAIPGLALISDAAYHGGIYSEFLVWWYNMVRANTLHRAAGRPLAAPCRAISRPS